MRLEILTRWPEAPDEAFDAKPLQRAEGDAIPFARVLHRAPDVDPAPPEGTSDSVTPTGTIWPALLLFPLTGGSPGLEDRTSFVW